MIYTKPSLSIQDQLALLKARNLIIPDTQRAERYLNFIGYYRLSVYFLPFQNDKDKFDNDTKFDDILNLYIFDRKLKLLVLDAIERIEIATKAVISNYMSQKFDIHWFLLKTLYIIDFMMQKITTKSTWLERVSELLQLLPEVFHGKHMGFPKRSIF